MTKKRRDAITNFHFVSRWLNERVPKEIHLKGKGRKPIDWCDQRPIKARKISNSKPLIGP